MKLKALAKKLGVKPVELIEKIESNIAPGCNVTTELSSEQVESVNALFQTAKPETLALDSSIINAELSQLLAGEIVQDERRQQLLQLADDLVAKYDADKELPTDPQQASLVKELWRRTKKSPSPMAGAIAQMAQQVQVVDGEVILPTIELPAIETAPESSLTSFEGLNSIVDVPALPVPSHRNSDASA